MKIQSQRYYQQVWNKKEMSQIEQNVANFRSRSLPYLRPFFLSIKANEKLNKQKRKQSLKTGAFKLTSPSIVEHVNALDVDTV